MMVMPSAVPSAVVSRPTTVIRRVCRAVDPAIAISVVCRRVTAVIRRRISVIVTRSVSPVITVSGAISIAVRIGSDTAD